MESDGRSGSVCLASTDVHEILGKTHVTVVVASAGSAKVNAIVLLGTEDTLFVP